MSNGAAALASMLWLMIANAIAWMTLPVLAPQVADIAGIDRSLIGNLPGIMFAGALLPTLLSGAFVPLLGPVRTNQIATIVTAIGLLIAAQGSLTALIISAVVIGAGYGPGSPASSAVLSRHTAPHLRGLIFSIRQSGVPLGGLLAGASLPVIAVSVGTREAIYVAAAICLVSAIVVEPVRKQLDADLTSPVRPDLAALLRNLSIRKAMQAHPDLPRVTYNGFAAAGVQGSVFALFVTLLVDRAHLDLVTAGLAFSALHLSGTIGRIVLGYLSDRAVRPQTLLAVLAAVGVTTLLALIVVVGFAPLPVILVLAALIGTTISGWNGVMLAEVARLSPPQLIGPVSAANITCIYAGYVVGPILTATLVASTGSYLIGFVPVSIALLLAALAQALHRLRLGKAPVV